MLRIAILSLLADGGSSGYDLSKAFDRSISYLWAASQSQIYPELHRLADRGLIVGEDVPQEGRPDKRVYRITEAGREALLEWVARPPANVAIRDPFQLSVVNAGRLTPDRARELVSEQRVLLQARVDVLESIRDMLEANGHVAGEPWSEAIGWRLTVEAGIRTAVAYVEWCDWAVERIDLSSVGDAPEASRRTT